MSLWTRVANLIARAVVERVDDSLKMQLLQVGVLAGETREGLERVQSYGFTSVPHPGAEAVVLFPGGYRDAGVVIACDDRRYRLKGLEAGEVAIYSDEGDRIAFKRGNVIEVVSDGTVEVNGATAVEISSAKVTVDAPTIELGQPAVDAAVKGTTYRAAEDTLLTALNTLAAAINTYAAAIAPIADPTSAATNTLSAAIGTFSGAVAAFQGAAATYLSTKVKVG